MNPFLIQGPAHISTSGGLTSGKMLFEILQANGGKLPPLVHALFCNTGKEREETLEFVHEIETQWNVPIVWLEYVPPPWPTGPLVIYRTNKDGSRDFGFFSDEDDPRNKASYRVVSFKTASRCGEPFDALIRHRSRINPNYSGTLPNPVAAWCSSELKQRTMRRWMIDQGYEDWTSVVGLRADERRRVSRMRGKKLEGGWIELPLADAGVSLDDVLSFWKKQHFDLKLRAYEGNCDLCPKKALHKIRTILKEGPRRADWWIQKEIETGASWREDRPSYQRLRLHVLNQCDLPIVIDEDEDSLPCTCTD